MVHDAMRHLDVARLGAAMRRLLLAMGTNEEEAGLVADHLVEANLCGHDSHGVGMVPEYGRAISAGDLRLGRPLRIDDGGRAILVCDADRGFGQVMAHRAMQVGIGRAQRDGIALVALRNSYHVGRIGHWAEQCAAAGLVSVHFVNVVSKPLVAPFGGTRPRLSTNPFAAGFPAADGRPPVIVDFATSRFALGKVRVARNKGVAVPPGTLMDAAGRPTQDPSVMFAEPPGALLPFGEHKGAALALTCELMAAALAGAPVQAGPPPDTAIVNSMLSLIVDPQAVGGRAAYLAAQTAVHDWICSQNAEGGVDIMLPGEPERRIRAERLARGIPIDPATLAAVEETARKAGIDNLLQV
ncbi:MULTISPECIES: malate/lactate/ureidoglycolate dehydrogenase [unclassified Roseitalea]|uniref:malate/lactate/ureidoglycolate dehydrogenase n=1 Tax=unclassified Roseitalea TaxID=2639107 RepID=UPI00273FAED2|nr:MULTISPECIES: malate/lactate/ureidoglycolate dehydrogenase [unclassified Roseitalea]